MSAGCGLNPTLRLFQERAKGGVDFQHLEELEGVPLVPGMSPSRISELREKMIIRPDDVFIVTYPKCGTTWMQQIVKLIVNNGVENGVEVDVCIPWIELMMLDEVESMPSPRFFKAHLPYQLMPGGGNPANTIGKYIYVIRNPKDTAVSAFYQRKKMDPPHLCVSWESYFEKYATGTVACGSFHSHILGWWTHRDSKNIVIVTFEQMKRDLPAVIGQVAAFLGYTLTDEVIRKIAEQTTFDCMKNNVVANKEYINPFTFGAESFMRKGVIGDWKNLFTKEQSDRIDAIVADKLGGAGLVFDYGDNLFLK